MLDTLTYFRAEIDTVGRRWQETVAGFDEGLALRRPAADMNHALWLTGHMAWAEDYFLMEIPQRRTVRRKQWDRFFDHSSERLPDEAYPPWREVRNEYWRVHDNAVRFLASLVHGEMHRPSAIERPWFPTAAHAVSHQVTHGHYHLGQLIYLSKMFVSSPLDFSV